ncbi:MAG: hypothetical protein CME32_19510 [Gimesia sp.]|uniref:Uncharacterized protein n=1 Tax=Gimesia chilikensis TaxID=2605989 RepID=A0A517PKJ1_9PLAN|nr:hypothetical protein [Gimesia chilikensis]MBN71457.1 hypothetical protein [Gimesia sp.]QDT19861.1 hypothetical protein HG66A1_16290 [Gimesia chilikensis]
MAKVRRQIQRQQREDPAVEARRIARIRKKHADLIKEQEALSRWMTRLKRAFHKVEKLQERIARMERQLADLEDRT